MAYKALRYQHWKFRVGYPKIWARCTTREKKDSDADSQLKLFQKSRTPQTNIETFEEQVAGRQISRVEAEKQSAANRSQYTQIISMSYTWQAQSATNLKRYKADREIWASKRADLDNKVKATQETISLVVATLAGSDKINEEQSKADKVDLATMAFW